MISLEPARGLHLERGLGHLAEMQNEDGSWSGDYGGSFFLTPMWACGLSAMGVIEKTTARDLLRHMDARRNADGGWGLHFAAPSCLFSTVMAYAAMRMLGRTPGEVGASRDWIRARGGAPGIPLWGKLFLSTLGLYDYEGVPPLSPEMWLLPRASPVHPGRLWCHARVVLLAMCHLYGRRFRIPTTPLVRDVRSEIYLEPWDGIDWRAQRGRVAPTDVHIGRTTVSGLVDGLLGLWERFPIPRDRALRETLDHIRHEDDTTSHIDIGPVNKILNMMVAWFEEGPDSEWFRSHMARVGDYLQPSREGLHVNGYNSTALWDTAFAVQAICAGGPRPGSMDVTLRRAASFLEGNQILEDVPDGVRYHRHPSRGGWPFSNRPHGWPISDCTGEGLKAALLLERHLRIPGERLAWAAEFILSLQNRDGGWATYEPTRGSALLERLNSSSLFQDIMIDLSCTECTSSCVQGLAAFRRRFPGRLRAEVEAAIGRGRDFLLGAQGDDGAWYGSWGICFTYGTWFGTWGLLAAGLDPSHPSLRRAAGFLASAQNPDGGWGEHWTSCEERSPIPSASHAVTTSWALLSLARTGHHPAVGRGLAYLGRTQQPSGAWPRQSLEGVFNRTCMLRYDNYRRYFPVWALGAASAPGA